MVQRPGCGGAKEKTESRSAGDRPLGHVFREAYLRHGSRPLETQLSEGEESVVGGRAGNELALVCGGGVSIHRVVLACRTLKRLVYSCFADCSPTCCGERIAVKV